MSADILIVDDSAIMRSMISRTIRMAGLAVERIFEASNGIEGYAVLADHPVAVVILDINMPVMNGVQFLTRMADDPRLRDVPVVIASTEGSQTRIQQLMEHGARGYVRKPFQPEQLRDVLAPFLPKMEDATADFGADDDAF